ncbi:hypothetical protein HPB52_006508 [Rhipicephalus sanguineus]|uniref:Ras-GAP domain-containing protein n=1 Tax=Rhipicephalus sanguineus TaxID=34632 RepID=A0A9D4SXW0_RHISA|nr:hypothetical protein HPB52_006508 [Rhipicephalus sanguineus]
MATKPVEWVSSLITRFEEQLPCRSGPQTTHSRINVEQNKECLINISKYKFSLVISGLTKILHSVNDVFVYQRTHSSIQPEFEKNFYESQLIVLDTLEKCLSRISATPLPQQPKETTRYDETMNVKALLRELCQFIDMPDSPMVVPLKNLASKVLFALSLNNFNAVFNRISGRQPTSRHSPCRLHELSNANEETTDFSDIELIQHINVDVARLIKLLNEINSKFRSLRKNAHLCLMSSLEKAIWNWMDTYPHEFMELQNKPNDELADACDRMFDVLDSFAENNKRRAQAWPLQIMLLVLCPIILEEIVNADSGAPCSPRHLKKAYTKRRGAGDPQAADASFVSRGGNPTLVAAITRNPDNVALLPNTTENMEDAPKTQDDAPMDEASPEPSLVLPEQVMHQEYQWQTVVSLHQRRRLRKQQISGEQEPGERTSTSKTTPAALALTRTPDTGEPCEHAEVPDNADARSRPRQRAPPLPRADLKVIIRPSPGLIVRELRSYQVAKAIIQATGRASTCKGEDFIVRLRRGLNIIIVSTPHEATAATLVKITSLTFQERPHPVKVYLSTPKDLCKGVVHGIDAGTSEEELLANLRVRTHGVRIVRARMLGQSQTALLHFEGPQLPQLVYFYGGEMPCRCYQPTRQFCPICRTPGHRPDVCPNPTARACDVCNLPNPEAGHTCIPKPQSQSPKRRSRSMPQHQRQAAATAAPDDNGFSQHQQNREASTTATDANKDRRQFIDNVKKALVPHGTSKQLTEAAAVTCVKLCKASTYINILDSNNVVFALVQVVINDLKLLLFNPAKPFVRSQATVAQDVELMTDCFVSCFRINPHNNEALKVCLHAGGPTWTYQHVLLGSLLRVVSQPRLAWWPQVDLLYSKAPELRHMFTETLNRVTQGFVSHGGSSSGGPAKMIPSLTLKEKVSTLKFKEKTEEQLSNCASYCPVCTYSSLLLFSSLFLFSMYGFSCMSQGKAGHEVQSSTLELINGLVSLVHQPPSMQDLAQEAMEALLVLHLPEHIERWNPEAPINTCWDLSSQALFSISQKLIQHQIIGYTDVLRWLREVLRCRNAFLARHREYANLGSHVPICKQAHIKLEVVFFMYLWSVDIDAVLVAMSCFALLCEEADIRCGQDDLTVTYLLPNYHVYQELATASTVLTTGRAVLQKRIMALLRKIEHCTQGCSLAWEDTFMNWDAVTKLLVSYPKSKLEEGQMICESLHRTIGKRRASHQSTEHELEDQVNEWANMTGFLCALGGVCLQRRSPSSSSRALVPATRSSLYGGGGGSGTLTSLDARTKGGGATAGVAGGGGGGMLTPGQDIQFCPVTQFVGQLLRLLVCHNEKFGTQIQKHVKDLVAHEMSPTLYPILFDQIKAIVEKFFDPQGQEGEGQSLKLDVHAGPRPNRSRDCRTVRGPKAGSIHAADQKSGTNRQTADFCFGTKMVTVIDTNTQFIEHVIFIMKSVFENRVDHTTEHLGVTSIEAMMLTIVRYVRHLDTTVHALHIKTKLCQLVEATMARRDDLAFRQEMKFRNKLVEYLTDWVMGNSHQMAPPGCGDVTAITRDLDQACMQAVAALLLGLPLQPEESDRGDLMEAKSQLFLKYFSLFMNLLNECSEAAPDEKDVGRHRLQSSKLGELRTCTIQAMSNLLSANIDSGLMHSIGLGYHKDLQTRAAFMEVLTKILQQGTEFDMLAETVLADRFEQLVQLVTMIGDKGELPIAMALASVVITPQMDELARVFVTLFDAKHLLSPLLWNMFYKELAAHIAEK